MVERVKTNGRRVTIATQPRTNFPSFFSPKNYIFFPISYTRVFLSFSFGEYALLKARRIINAKLILRFIDTPSLSIFNATQGEGRGALGRISAIQFRGYQEKGRDVDTSCCQKFFYSDCFRRISKYS